MALTKKKKRFLLIFLGVYFVISLCFAVFNAQKRKFVDSPDLKRLSDTRHLEIYDKLKAAEAKAGYSREPSEEKINQIYVLVHGVSPDDPSQDINVRQDRLSMLKEGLGRSRGEVDHEDAKLVYNIMYGAKQDDPLKPERMDRIEKFIQTEMASTPSEEQIQKIYGAIYGPKLEPISINFTMIMQMLNFGALATMLYVLLWDPLTKFLDERGKKVQGDIDSAEAKNAEAEKTLQEYKRKLHDARDDVALLMEEGRKRGEEKEKEIIEDARREVERIKERAQAALAAAETAARRMLRDEFAAVSVGIAEKILDREITEKDHASLVEQALAGLEKEGVKF